ncbi:MAG: hypothetical protein CVU40_16315, partial [Chloroflexi bacterium HGW-Chloroflexi-2]
EYWMGFFSFHSLIESSFFKKVKRLALLFGQPLGLFLSVDLNPRGREPIFSKHEFSQQLNSFIA